MDDFEPYKPYEPDDIEDPELVETPQKFAAGEMISSVRFIIEDREMRSFLPSWCIRYLENLLIGSPCEGAEFYAFISYINYKSNFDHKIFMRGLEAADLLNKQLLANRKKHLPKISGILAQST